MLEARWFEMQVMNRVESVLLHIKKIYKLLRKQMEEFLFIC